MGLEPTVFGSGNRRLVHLATGTCVPEVGFEPTRTNAQQILSLPPWTSRVSSHSTTMFYKGQSKTVSFRPKKCKTKVLPGLEPGSQDSESWVMNITL